jgi:ElaB/YqjD/DUF883 family membrane-anchored ribosome-binding protein
MAMPGEPSRPSSAYGAPVPGSVAQSADKLKSDALDALRVSKDTASAAVSQVSDAVGRYAGDAQASVEQYVSQARDFVRANPTQGILYALGAGFVLGLLLKR